MVQYRNSIKASPEERINKASITSETYLRGAIDAIDRQLGPGYAKTHPELVSAFMLTSSIAFVAAMVLDEMLDR